MDRQYRNTVVKRMEKLIGLMQHPDTGVPFKSQKMFLSTIPAAVAGSDFLLWLNNHLNTAKDTNEAHTIANMFCYYGYLYPIADYKSLVVKDDPSILYRFQAPYFWLSKVSKPDAMDYAIYLVKRSLRGGRQKQKYSPLEDYEQSALDRLQKMLCDKWEFIYMQAEEQVRLGKERKKADRTVIHAQERAFWRVHRPPPGRPCRVEEGLARHIALSQALSRKEARMNQHQRQQQQAKLAQDDPIKSGGGALKSIENLIMHNVNNSAYDWFLDRTDMFNYWLANPDSDQWPSSSLDDGFSTVKQVRMWAINFDCLLRDPYGRRRFEQFLEKEFSAENLKFWKAVNRHKFGAISQIKESCAAIFAEFLGNNASSEINVDSRTMAATERELKNPSRFTFEDAQEHIYTLMKNDSYVRFLRSDDYGNALRYALERCNSSSSGAGSRSNTTGGAGVNGLTSSTANQNAPSKRLVKPSNPIPPALNKSTMSANDNSNKEPEENKSPSITNAVAPWDEP